MAKGSSLRQFQEAILAKLQQATAVDAAESRSRLGVDVGGRKYLINLAQIVEVLPVPMMQAVPLTKDWFLGVANIRGLLYNVTDLPWFINGVPSVKNSHNRLLLVNSETTTQAALLINALIGLRNLSDMQELALTEAENSFYAQRKYQDESMEIWLEFDFDALLNHPEFIHPNMA